LVVICVATFAVITLLGPPFSVDLPLSRVAGAVGGQFLLAAALGSFALFLACVTGKRGISRALSGLVGLLAFLLNSAAPSIDALRPYRSASLLYHAVGIDPLRNGVDPVNVAVPLGVAVVLTIAAVLVFQRRDIAV
jgi:ABC-2 type transport system permease protein